MNELFAREENGVRRGGGNAYLWIQEHEGSVLVSGLEHVPGWRASLERLPPFHIDRTSEYLLVAIHVLASCIHRDSRSFNSCVGPEAVGWLPHSELLLNPLVLCPLL